MFITKEEIKERSGYDVTPDVLNLAHIMIEAYVGKTEADVADASDRAILGRAVMFQAAFMDKLGPTLMEQVAMKSIVIGETTTIFDTSMFSPYMSPWAVWLCRGLSWNGTRTVHTGPVFDRGPVRTIWERD